MYPSGCGGDAYVNIKFDANRVFQDALAALQAGHIPAWVIFCLIGLLMSPWIIPALSKAIAEHRNLSHKREQNLLKIRNSVKDRKDRAQRRAPRGRSK